MIPGKDEILLKLLNGVLIFHLYVLGLKDKQISIFCVTAISKSKEAGFERQTSESLVRVTLFTERL